LLTEIVLARGGIGDGADLLSCFSTVAVTDGSTSRNE
jgi:hypothetical protein